MIELWGIPIYWYTPALLAPFIGAWLGGVFDDFGGNGSCSACAAGYCKEHS